MPLFALVCIDKPNSLAVRMGARERHLAWAKDQPLKLGGPFLDEKGDMAGSLIIIEVEDLAAARAFNAADPYTQAGLWASVDIRPFRVTIDKL
ncbi:MAG TPA: YciI family protein [Phenylobacterium sp.]|uniref:YciI family protein n=1 Tax=Phenylobacterium sp. TaxID=1871053 RepID=UPI002B8466A2|nr:YciI family protein [Phenylobacterium sp.]HSV01827.1 YciI family protein [Phenylobacterium sp.]